MAAGVLTTPPDMALPERLANLSADLSGLLAEFEPAAVVVERVVFQTAVRNAIPVAQAAGIALALAFAAGCEVTEYAANEVKLSVTGNGAADKQQVQKMVAALLKLPAPPEPADAADALALALCYLNRSPLAARMAAAR